MILFAMMSFVQLYTFFGSITDWDNAFHYLRFGFVYGIVTIMTATVMIYEIRETD
jgi:hypothetical protein